MDFKKIIKNIVSENADLEITDEFQKALDLIENTSENVFITGKAGSGKSTFWKNHFASYERINRDTLKTKEKCLKIAEETIKSGKNLVIDNTNPTAEDRKAFIELAKKHSNCFNF